MPDNPTQPAPQEPSKPTPTAGPRQVQSLYFNGFFLGMSNADIVMRLNLEHTELLDLRMSFTIAKTLAEKLTETVAKFEQLTDHKLMTTEDVFKALQKAGLKP